MDYFFTVQFLLIPCGCTNIPLNNKLHTHTLHAFLTLSACKLCDTASHLWHLHVLSWVDVLKTNKVRHQAINHKKEIFWGILDICMVYVRPWVN